MIRSKKGQWIINLLFIILILIGFACQKESVGDLIFTLSFKVDKKINIIDVEYSSGLTSKIPLVKANGKEIEEFSLGNGCILGQVSIPFERSVDYSIRLRDKFISRNFKIPNIDDITCNNINLDYLIWRLLWLPTIVLILIGIPRIWD